MTGYVGGQNAVDASGFLNPPKLTVLFVAGLANLDFLVEIDAVAVVPEA